MSKWRKVQEVTRADKRAYHRLLTGITWHARKGTKKFRFLTLTGITSQYRKNFDKLRRIIRKAYGKFEYFSVRTQEGKEGVLHILFAGSYIPQRELKEKWLHASGSWALGIQKVTDFKWQGFEMTRQQLTARYSHSKGWLPPGIPRLWKQFKQQFKGIPHTTPDQPYDMEKWHDMVWHHSEPRQRMWIEGALPLQTT